jgi:hypothetical protein
MFDSGFKTVAGSDLDGNEFDVVLGTANGNETEEVVEALPLSDPPPSEVSSLKFSL